MRATRKIAINACFAFISMISALFGAETAATKMLKAGNAEFRKEVIGVTKPLS
ncbi:MAG: hypothetical protein ACYTBX_15145 [Planctomycetota bacterium]|jgi:hypothetical protein